VTDDAPRRSFSVTWDYRCPFARNAHEQVVAGLRAGAAWDVTFSAFSLGQVHVEEGQPDIWDRWQEDTGLLALQAGVVVRDEQPDRFLDAHEALFALRHDHGGHLRDEGEVRETLAKVDVDVDAVFDAIATGKPLQVVREEHERAAAEHGTWGVPTFAVGPEAAFIRFMHRPNGDGEGAIRSIERVLDLLEWPELNEFKRPRIPR
jgi:hypothetical protein